MQNHLSLLLKTLRLKKCDFLTTTRIFFLYSVWSMISVTFPLSAGRMVILSSLRRCVMAHLTRFLMLYFGGLAPFNALLISFLRRLASPHLSCCHLCTFNVATIFSGSSLHMVYYGTVHHDKD